MLKIRPFRRLWIVLGVASLGDWLGLLATATFASAQVSGSAAKGLAFGSVIAVRLLPALVFGPVAGVLADRFDRRYMMAICDVLRFFLFASIPLVALQSTNSTVTIGWAAVATFLIETITLIWIPAKEAAVPNLIPRGRLEDANQLTLITTYGITPVLAALGLAGLNQLYHSVTAGGVDLPETTASTVALYFNALSRLATAVVVFFGIREISGRDGRHEVPQESALRQFLDGWRYIARSPLVRGLVLGILGAFACGGLVIGTAQFYARSLSGGDSTFYLLFGLIFIGLGVGIALGPRLIGQLSRRRWFGLSIMLAALSVAALALAPHLSVAAVGTLLVGAGAGMAFLSGTTLLGGEVEDEVRGRVFAFVQTSVRVVLMLAIALSGVLVGAGGSPEITIKGTSVPISSTRVLLFIAGICGTLAGYWALRQMDDKPGVPLLRDIWASMRGRPLGLVGDTAVSGMFIVFEGGEGAGKSTQIELLAQHLRDEGREVLVTREPGATAEGARIRELLLETHSPEGALSALGPRAEALLYAADRAHHVDSVVRPALDRGVVVISDRYIDSSLAYQGAGRTLDSDEVAWLSSWATEGLTPDLTVLLDIDPRIGLDRVAERGDGHDRLESEAISFHDRVRFAFLGLADAEPARYLVVDATLPVDRVGGAVAEKVDSMLPPLHEADTVFSPGHGVPEPPTFRSPGRLDRAEVTADLAARRGSARAEPPEVQAVRR
ncbi:MAG: dTMP kinase [Hamadaea sp.]|nr:dTMP kinase [Hamadaea sp.]NUT05943.1 dTMP kinase [Hamadaea sp.]